MEKNTRREKGRKGNRRFSRYWEEKRKFWRSCPDAKKLLFVSERKRKRGEGKIRDHENAEGKEGEKERGERHARRIASMKPRKTCAALAFFVKRKTAFPKGERSKGLTLPDNPRPAGRGGT